MVFEAIVVDLLNKFLKQYIENLDTSQLKIGIWGGDVVLADLIIKQTIFKEFNLPFKVAYGKLGKLSLKIPWKNLYGEATSAFIEDLFILFVPNTETEYNAQKEEKWYQEKKQQQLKLLDEAKKKEQLKGKPETPDTFMEKLVMQIIKTIQIEIKNIHVRYEDRTTDPQSPFSIGATISNLSLKSTAGDPFPLEFQKSGNLQFIYKIIQLEGLSVYWNPDTDLLAKLPPKELQTVLLKNIPKPDFKPPDYKYVFGPLVAKGLLRLNPKPESDGTNFATPKVFILVQMEEIKLAVSRKQYRSITLFLQNIQRISAASKYRKYKPFGVPVIGHAKEWWRFAYACVSEDIKRRRTEWDWQHIKTHREMCKNYEELFRIKTKTKKLSKIQENELEDLEKRLNTFNLILLREKVYLEVERLAIAENETKVASGWFSYFFSYGGPAKSEDQEDDLVTKLGKVMTPKEKEKLYKAIDYQETFSVCDYPDYYIEFKFIFKLKALRLRVYDDKTKNDASVTVLSASLNDVNLLFEKRTSANAMKVTMNLGDFTVLGKASSGEEVPELVKSSCKKNEQLMEVLLETNPLDGYCDQRVHVHASALLIIYHASTVNILRDIFHPDTEDDINAIVAATAASLPTFREITSMGLQYAIAKSSRLEVRVHLLASKLIVPYDGVYEPNKEFLLLKLGQFDVTTEERTDRDMSVKKLYLQGSTEKDIFSIFLSASYRKFKCQLMGVQILYRLPGEDWAKVLESTDPSPLRLLEPTNLTIIIKKCLVTDDARIPKAVIEGNLPSIAINISEDRAVCLAGLVSSIPTSLPDVEPPIITKQLSTSAWSLQSFGTQIETKLRPKVYQKEKVIAPEDFVQGIDLVARFEMNKFVVTVSKTTDVNSSNTAKSVVEKAVKPKSTSTIEEKFLQISILSVNCEMTSKTFETLAELKLGAIEVKQNHNNALIPIVETKGHLEEEEEYYLFLAEYVNVDKKIPDFFSKRGGVVTILKLNFTTLNVLFHKEAVVNHLAFLSLLQNRLAEVKVNQKSNVGENISRKMASILEDGMDATFSEKKIVSKGKKFRKKKQAPDIIDLVVEVNMNSLNMKITSDFRDLLSFGVQGGKIDLSSRKSYTNVDCKLSEVLILDLNNKNKHRKIVSSVDNQTLSMKATIFNQEFLESSKSVDISFEAEVGRVRMVFLNKFINTALDFMDTFQKEITLLKEGASAAAQKAKEGVLKAYENESKISLNIKITAPLIVFPRKSTTMDVLLIDMGILTIKSFITELEDTGSLNIAATNTPLMDVIRCHLENVKVMRALLSGESGTTLKESSILDPITMELTLNRNLSVSWYKDMVPLEVQGRLELVHLRLTHSDLCFMVHSLQENFAEGSGPQKTSEVSQMYKEDEKSKVAITNLKSGEVAASEKALPSIVFSFRADLFIFDNVNDHILGNGELVCSNLARFTLEVFSLKGTIFSNGSISTTAFLSNVKIDDTRPGKQGRITNLMRRNTDEAYGPKVVATDLSNVAMVNISYERKEVDSFVDIRVYGFNLILSMDFISKLLVFFTIDDYVLAQPPILTQTKQTEVKRSGSSMKPVKMAAQGKSSREKKDEFETGPLPTFTVNIRLEKPDIIIVENMDSSDTDALVFNTELLMKYRSAGTRQVITGTLSDITLVSCNFNDIKKAQSEIIKPFTISMAGSTPEDQGLHVDICLTDIHLSINAKTVELLSKCQQSFLSDSTRDLSAEEPVDYSGLWDIKTFKDDDYWFLKTEEGVDALLTLSRRSSRRSSNKKVFEEICLLSIPSVVITFESMSGKNRIPLILFEMSLQGQILNWTSQLTIDFLIKIQMQYFNKSLSAWEPLIEPTEVIRDKKSFFAPWELDCSVVLGNDNENDPSGVDEENVSGPTVTATLSCSENLEITITKSCVDVLQNLTDAFTTAVTNSQTSTKTETYPPYIVKNETGVLVELLLNESNLQVYGTKKKDSYKIVRLESGGEVELKEDRKSLKSSGNVKKVFIEEKKELFLYVKSSIFGANSLELPISRTAKRYYAIKNPSASRESWGLISDVNISQNSDVITLRSILQIKNDFQEAIHVHYPVMKGKDLEYIGTVEGNSVLNLPFHSVYNPIKELYFKVEGFSISTSPLSWKNIKNEITATMLLQCNPNNIEDTDPFFILAIGEVENVYFENTYRHTISSMCINIYLQPTVQLLNCLPVDLIVCSQGSSREMTLSSAERLQITHAEPGVSAITLRIQDYLEKEWSCKETIPDNPSEFAVWTFTSYNGLTPEILNVGILHSIKRSSSVFKIYCPYLMVNNTGHLLSYRFDDNSSTVFHPSSHTEPVMFSPGVKKFFSKKKALLKVNQGDWSDKFPIDVAGSGGTIECYNPDTNHRYLIAVTITLTFNNLSKIVLFTPYYVLLNKTSYHVQCKENLSSGQSWITIPPHECLPFWPDSEEKRKTAHLRIKDTNEITPPFCYDSTDSVLLKLKNKYGGLFVEIQTTNAGNNIIISSYEPGLAPALILNHTKEVFLFQEKGTQYKVTLNPQQMFLCTWTAPTQERKLLFNDDKHKEFSFNLKEDVDGNVVVGKHEIRYVSFLDGFQRILLFTDDADIRSDTMLAGQENFGLEVILNIHGIGVSVVNNMSQTEILYMGFVSSGITWETKRENRSRFKPMAEKDSFAVENAYKKYEESANIDGTTDTVVVIDNKIQINFETMEMLYPNKRVIRRVFEPGLRTVYRTTENYITLHIKINKIQIDNQLHDSIFPIVLCPVPPPKTVAISHGPKPFFELSMLKVSAGQSRVQQYKYFKILVQEFSVKIDIGFINQCWAFLTVDEANDEENKAKFKKDLSFCEQPLLSHVTVSSSTEQKNFYDLLHFSPLKMHFSFSLAGNIESSIMPPALSVLLQSLGVTLTDFHDVLFRLSYFERKSAFLTHGQLVSEVVRHYYGQAIRQAYVLVLGLDVIGNPFGLVIGIGQGVEAFFYEPVQGIIQGPSDFATGVALGCRSLFGHAVGGTAGTLGRITGTLGKGLAVLSLDKEYQRERMEQQYKRTDNISASMAQGGKGVVMGVYEGVTGVVMKPISGAKEEGVGGFFKGVGKGMMGLVTRPVTGVVDFASTSLNAVKRAAEFSTETKRLRPPRFFQDDKLVLPYKKREAYGNSILYEIEKRKYSKTDKYEYHAELRGKEVLLLTDKRMLLAEYSDIFGNWQVHLDITWLEMLSPPKEHQKGVAIHIPRKKGNIFQSQKDLKVLAVDDIEMKEVLCKKMIELYFLETRSGT